MGWPCASEPTDTHTSRCGLCALSCCPMSLGTSCHARMRTNSFESIVPSSLSLPKNRAAWFTVFHKCVLSFCVQPTRTGRGRGGGQIKAPPGGGEHQDCAAGARSSYLGDVGKRDIQLAQLHFQLIGGHLPEFGTSVT